MESSVRRRRWSREHPPTFSDLLKKLPKYASSFIKVFQRKKQRMKQIVCGLQKIAAEVKQMKEKSKKVRVTGLVFAAVGVVAAAALFAGSFTIVGAAALSVAAGATAVIFTKKRFTRQKESGKKVKAFLKIVELLRTELEEIKKVCEDLQRESVGAEPGNTARLKDDINKLLEVTAKLKTSTTSDCITDVSDQFKKAFGEFEKMRRKLKDLRERTDTEKMEQDSD